MDEKKIRQIVQQELQRSNNAARFGVNNIPFHTHDGVNSPQIKEESVQPGTSITGTVSFAQVTTYQLNLNASFTPRNIQVHGVVTGTDAGAVRALVVGSAQLTPTFYFQPNDSTSVVTGDLQFPFNGKPAQSSSYLSVDRGNDAGVFALTSEDHICSVTYNSIIWARATVVSFSRTAITIDVPYLESGWEINLNFVIT